MTIRPSHTCDLAAVENLLQQASLPVLGVRDHFSHYLVAEENGSVIGAIGLEHYGETGLLRSAVVSPEHQGNGVGTVLYDQLLRNAMEMGIRRLLLLTDTAEEYFRKKGFRKIDQESVRGPVRESVEFSGACPSHAVCMELRL